MKKKKIIILSIMIIVVALLLEASILKYVNDRNAHRTSKVLLDRVITVLDKNDESRNELIESLKDDYIVRAKAVSYMIDADPAVEYDVDELQKIAKLMAVDEIHLFDDQGTIYSGSAPKYFGYNFDSGAQMEYFKPMLKDKSLTMCQDVTPNTAEGKKMMYAITWNEDGTKMLQVGIKPKRLLNEIKQNNISNVVAGMPVYKGMEIMVADGDTQVIEGATDSSKLGEKLEDVGISADHVSADGATVLFVLLIVFFALLMAATGLIAALPAVLYEVLPAVNWATVGSSPGLTVAMSVAGILVIGIPIIGLIHMLMRHFGGWQPMSIVTKIIFIVLWLIALGVGVFFVLNDPNIASMISYSL